MMKGPRLQSDLTENEEKIRQLLLDTSHYIGTSGKARPILRFAGGWVRDKLLGSASDDIDVAIDNMAGKAFGKEIEAFVSGPGAGKYAASEEGKAILGKLTEITANHKKSKHLETATIRIYGLGVDLVNLRRETYAADSRTPTMEFGTPEEDALRRDSTVNALFYNILTEEVEDFTGRGLADLDRKLIKTPLPPLETFKDDPLRVLRHIRFASRLGFEVASDDEKAMKDPGIKEEFKKRIPRKTGSIGNRTKGKGQPAKSATELKISRERVGIEVTKMLRDPNPAKALTLVDEYGLYDTIFTDADNANFGKASTTNWRRTYIQLCELVSAQTPPNEDSHDLAILRTFLLRNSVERYHAWVLCAMVPWARAPMVSAKEAGAKTPQSRAYLAVRRGIMADNKVSDLVADSVRHLDDVISVKDESIAGLQATELPQKRSFDTLDMDSRVEQGNAIRRWGSQWRSVVVYALLVQISENQGSSPHTVLEGYARWLDDLETNDLFDVYNLKPIVNGGDLAETLGEKPGKLIGQAIDVVIQWQLRNPGRNEPEEAKAEVRRWREGIGHN